jgi:hypothetical protein
MTFLFSNYFKDELNSLHQECPDSPTRDTKSRIDDIDTLPEVIKELEALETKSLGLIELIAALKHQ